MRPRCCGTVGPVTFSVIARDDSAGLLGVAVSSCVLAVGARVPAVRAGVGVVAVQAGGWLQWRQILLDLLERGLTTDEAIAAVTLLDDHDEAQLAVVADLDGAAAYTGSRCDLPAGHAVVGAVSAQANTTARDGVWDEMATAVSDAPDLAEGLLAALAVAEVHGGDMRGRQSAALMVVPNLRGHLPTGDGDDPTIDLRVDDSPDPVGALARLHRLHAAHRMLIRSGNLPDAEQRLELMRRAADLAPDDPLCGPATGLALALAGRVDEGMQMLHEAVSRGANPEALRWAEWRARNLAGVNRHAEALLARLRRSGA